MRIQPAISKLLRPGGSSAGSDEDMAMFFNNYLANIFTCEVTILPTTNIHLVLLLLLILLMYITPEII